MTENQVKTIAIHIAIDKKGFGPFLSPTFHWHYVAFLDKLHPAMFLGQVDQHKDGLERAALNTGQRTHEFIFWVG